MSDKYEKLKLLKHDFIVMCAIISLITLCVDYKMLLISTPILILIYGFVYLSIKYDL